MPEQSVVASSRSSAAPRVFLSYSWEGPEHKEWVRRFAERLQRESGVEVIFDRWHLSPGDDKLHFMEQGVAKSDFVVVICSPSYAQRANDRQGGVGYESMVITSELAEHMGTNRFIPILRKGTWTEALPIYLKSRMGVNLSDEPYSEEEYLNLSRALHREPMQPPPIGSRPNFPKLPDTGQSSQRTEHIDRAQQEVNTRTDHFLADLISELEDNLDKARRPQTGETYRQPSDKIWLENRNKLHLSLELRSQVNSAYHDISAWADIVRTGIHPNLGSMQLNLLASGLTMSLPWVIEQLRKVQPRTDELEQRVTDAPSEAKGANPTPSAEIVDEMKKSNSIADAFYETTGPDAKRIQMWVRHSPRIEDLYMLENSAGERHFGTREEIALKFSTENKLLVMRGFTMMNFGNRCGDRAFDL